MLTLAARLSMRGYRCLAASCPPSLRTLCCHLKVLQQVCLGSVKSFWLVWQGLLVYPRRALRRPLRYDTTGTQHLAADGAQGSGLRRAQGDDCSAHYARQDDRFIALPF